MSKGRERMQQKKPPLGAGVGKAFLRQGLKEVAQVLPAFPDSNVRVVEEPGQIGNVTPREVYESKGKDKQHEPGE